MYSRSLIFCTPLARVGCFPQPGELAAWTEVTRLSARAAGRSMNWTMVEKRRNVWYCKTE